MTHQINVTNERTSNILHKIHSPRQSYCITLPRYQASIHTDGKTFEYITKSLVVDLPVSSHGVYQAVTR